MVPERPFHVPEVSRRQILVSTGTFIAGGGVVAATGSQPAQAAVNQTELQVPPAEVSGKDGSVASVDIEVLGNYEYRVADGDTLVLALEVAAEDGDDPNYQTIDRTDESLGATTGAGSYTLAGSLLNHDSLDAQLFSAEPETSTTRRVPVRVVMNVLAGEETVVTATSSTVAEVTVENTSIKASAAVMGEGEIAVTV